MSFSTATIASRATVIAVDTRTVPKVVYLPTVSTNQGRILILKDYYGVATNSTITVSTTGTDLIDDVNWTATMRSSFMTMSLLSDGLRSWRITGLYNGALIPPPSGSFLPTQISGLRLWLDPTDSSTVTRSGANVSAWADKSGNGWNMTTQNGSPQYNTSLINNLPGMDVTNSSAFISVANQTISSNASLAMILVVKSGIANWGSFFTHGSRDTDIAMERNSISAGTTLQFQTANDNTGANITYTVDQNSLYLGTITTGTSRFFERFGGGTTTTATGTNGYSMASGLQTIRIGRSDAGESCNSLLGEIVYYNKVLSTLERQQVEGYLAWKWGLQGSLPADHPYKNAPP
jgi:hypothetical protein